jgi:hypothetical protein
LFQGVINLDMNTAIDFVAEGSPIRHQLKAFAGNQQLVMVRPAYDEFLKIIQASECLSPSSVFIDR